MFLLVTKSNTKTDNKTTPKSSNCFKIATKFPEILAIKTFARVKASNSMTLITAKCIGFALLKKLEIIYNVCIFAL
ncbi:hypothetical protein GCM10009431_04110 [Gaetbulibacter jejuensis]|uniref:Uncharacterized protein n=1 Tax=Gaetbulibacter jejuensis TaxID=584607 RepID=A0ABN1JEI9_9FLAO